MCTAATYKTKDFYFGRTLDYEFSYGEEVTITPRNYSLHFREKGDILSHYAMIGVAHVAENYPLYYDAVNEKGLAIAGLNFVGNAYYRKRMGGKDNIAQFELIPWILSQCASVKEACALLGNINITDTVFSNKYPLAQLHWMISDRERSITLESVKEGIKIYENPVGVLTNNPPFDMQLFNLNNYRHLSRGAVSATFAPDNFGLHLQEYSRGMGAMGLPGDLSSQSRFVRVAFVKTNSVSGCGEEESVSQFFHLLDFISQPRGCTAIAKDVWEYTLYASCCSTRKGIYYYRTYDAHRICAVDLRREDPEGSALIRHPLQRKLSVFLQNETARPCDHTDRS